MRSLLSCMRAVRYNAEASSTEVGSKRWTLNSSTQRISVGVLCNLYTPKSEWRVRSCLQRENFRKEMSLLATIKCRCIRICELGETGWKCTVTDLLGWKRRGFKICVATERDGKTVSQTEKKVGIGKALGVVQALFCVCAYRNDYGWKEDVEEYELQWKEHLAICRPATVAFHQKNIFSGDHLVDLYSVILEGTRKMDVSKDLYVDYKKKNFAAFARFGYM